MPQPLNSNNDVPWITRANHRIANNNYTRAEKFTMCLPMVLTNCNGYDVLVTRTDSSTRTNICIPCFIECGKIKCAIGPGAGLSGKSCCGKHRTKNIQIMPDIVTSNQASKDRAINDNLVQSNSKSIRDVSTNEQTHMERTERYVSGTKLIWSRHENLFTKRDHKIAAIPSGNNASKRPRDEAGDDPQHPMTRFRDNLVSLTPKIEDMFMFLCRIESFAISGFDMKNPKKILALWCSLTDLLPNITYHVHEESNILIFLQDLLEQIWKVDATCANSILTAMLNRLKGCWGFKDFDIINDGLYWSSS